jgi:hypothetical protein
VKAGTLICEEDSGATVVLGHKLGQFPIVAATWDRRLHAAAAASVAAERAAELSAEVRVCPSPQLDTHMTVPCLTQCGQTACLPNMIDQLTPYNANCTAGNHIVDDC